MPQKILLSSQHESGQRDEDGADGRLKERERENIQRKYIQHYAFSTNNEKQLSSHIFQEKLFLQVLKSCKNQVYSKGLKTKSLMNDNHFLTEFMQLS